MTVGEYMVYEFTYGINEWVLLGAYLPQVKQSEKILFAYCTNKNIYPAKEFQRLSRILYHKFTPLEELPIEEKRQLWDYVKSNATGTKEELIEVTKIVYIISKYL